MDLPTIKFELEGIRQTIQAALFDQQDAIKKAIEASLRGYLSNECFLAIIDKEVTTCVATSVKEAIGAHYRYGKGQDFINETVSNILVKMDINIEKKEA